MNFVKKENTLGTDDFWQGMLDHTNHFLFESFIQVQRSRLNLVLKSVCNGLAILDPDLSEILGYAGIDDFVHFVSFPGTEISFNCTDLATLSCEDCPTMESDLIALFVASMTFSIGGSLS